MGLVNDPVTVWEVEDVRLVRTDGGMRIQRWSFADDEWQPTLLDDSDVRALALAILKECI